ncbi:MAG: hypothetical protein KDA61_20235, partial [Planctomycetales bacterium]|nr:hypothetical protein [Planctomycetales bacterium]
MKLALHIAFGAMAIALVLPSLAHADLFANLPAMGEVRQLQTDGTPVASYPYLELDISSQPPLASLSRLGDWNYLSVTLGGQLVFHLFNSTTDEFFPSIYVDLLAVVPTPDPPGPVTGMALRQLEDHLEIVLATRPRLNEGPGYVSRVQVPTTEPGMPFDSFSLIAESPPVALPEGFFPNGADLDPLTGEMWVVGNLGAPQGGNVQIL